MPEQHPSFRKRSLHRLQADSCKRRPVKLSLEQLEDRAMPAVTFQFDYSLDTSGFFADPSHRAVLEQAGQLLGNQLTDSLAAISPGGGNAWTASFTHPSNNSTVQRNNLSIGANTILVFAGGENFGGATLGVGGPGGWSAQGTSGWFNLVAARGQAGALAATPTDFGTWGGSVTFDTATNWNFAGLGGMPGPGQYDFLSVAVHELGHVLGIGTADSWYANVSGSSFVGANAKASYGGPVPLQAGGAHWANGVTVAGAEAALDPSIGAGLRKLFTSVDWAALRDIGWNNNTGIASTPPGPPAQLNQVALAFTRSDEYFINLVKNEYLQLLGRSADLAGLNNWLNAMRQGLSHQQLDASFLSSQEFMASRNSSASWVNSLYQILLGRSADAGGLNTWLNALQQGWTPYQVAYAVAASGERGSIQIAAYYQQYLGRSADSAGLASWVSSFQRGMSFEAIAAAFVCSPEYYARCGGSPSTWLTAVYQDFLHRIPDSSGYATWLQALQPQPADQPSW